MCVRTCAGNEAIQAEGPLRAAGEGNPRLHIIVAYEVNVSFL